MPNLHFTDDGESQECTSEPCPPHPNDVHLDRFYGHMNDVSGALAAVGYATVNITPAFASIYDALNALGPAIRPPRSNKAARARAKAAKLRQRRAAMAAPRPWGTDWRATASMLRMSIASIARDGVPCHAVPCPPMIDIRPNLTVLIDAGADT